MTRADRHQRHHRTRRAVALVATALAIAACSGGDDADETVAVTATEFAFTLEPPAIAAGDEVSFHLRNAGTLQHELEVFDPTGTALGEVAPLDPGEEGEVTLRLGAPGVYRLVCGIDGHEAKGMVQEITVSGS